MIKFILERLRFIFLDFLSIPSLFLNKKNNAKYHLKVMCPMCPKSRRKYRDVQGKGKCWWEQNWEKSNYTIPRNFGIINWFRTYVGINTKLTKFKK